MTDPSIGTVIVRHIDELEAALRYASGTMQPMLAKAVAAMLEERRIALGWAGEAVADLTETLWMAPREWKIAGDPEDDDFDLSFSLGTMPCISAWDDPRWL